MKFVVLVVVLPLVVVASQKILSALAAAVTVAGAGALQL